MTSWALFIIFELSRRCYIPLKHQASTEQQYSDNTKAANQRNPKAISMPCTTFQRWQRNINTKSFFTDHSYKHPILKRNQIKPNRRIARRIKRSNHKLKTLESKTGFKEHEKHQTPADSLQGYKQKQRSDSQNRRTALIGNYIAKYIAIRNIWLNNSELWTSTYSTNVAEFNNLIR